MINKKFQMKEEKLKDCESQNSLKGKSTLENSKISERIRSSKHSLLSKENLLPKKAKKIIMIKKVTKLKKNKPTEKQEKPKPNGGKIKEITSKLSKTSLRTKISNKMLNKTNTNEKSGKTPSQPIKKNKKIDKSILTMTSLSRIKEKENLNSKPKNKNIKNVNNISLIRNSFLTIQNSSKIPKNNNFKKNQKIKKNLEFEDISENLDDISLDISPKLITDKMYKKEKNIANKKNNNLNNKNNNIKSTKLISLSKNKNNNKNFFNEINSRLNQTYRTKTLNTSICNKNKNKNNDSSLRQSFNISIDKTKIKNKRKTNYIKTEFTIDNNKKENQKNNIPKSGFNKFNYLKYTISALNKIVKKKEKEKEKENNNKANINSITSRPFSDKKNKSINRKETKNKMKTALILRNTINRYKLYKKKDLFLDDDVIRESIKSPNLTKRYSTLHNSTKNYFNKIDNYKMLKSLGKGSYGEVKLAVEKITGIKYAIKIYSKKVFDDPKKKRNIENEIKILKQLDNINIMKLHEVIKTDRFNYLIMEYIDGISLLEIIKKEKKHYLEEKRALKIFMQIVKAIEYCQSKNICHRDIKLENILTLKNDIIKLIDFGFAVKTNKETFQTLLCGSPSYMAPEIVKKEKYIAQYSDIWSLGVLLYSMLFGRFPFKGKTQEELFENIKKCEFEFPEEIEVSDEIKLLFKKIFVDIPAQRPSLNEILNDINLIGD